ncbi:MAG: hypothetical protein ABR607_11760 [Pyrinomonadaceae bacterium]
MELTEGVAISFKHRRTNYDGKQAPPVASTDLLGAFNVLGNMQSIKQFMLKSYKFMIRNTLPPLASTDLLGAAKS